jgi:hypothetical protein
MPKDERLQTEGRVKQAVKEALFEQSIIEMNKQLAEMKTQIGEGFRGVHQRQDMTNGKVLKAKEDIIVLQNDIEKVNDRISIPIKIMYGTGASIGLALLGAAMKVLLK